MKALRICLAAALAAAGVLAIAPAADAAHHLVKIRQVYAGDTAGGEAHEFVVLQLTSSGENQFVNPFPGMTSGQVKLYSAAGAETNAVTFSGSNPPVGSNQATVLVATTGAEGAFTADADFNLPSVDALDPAGGAACFTSEFFGGLDCVGWGSLVFASLPSPIGTVEPAFANGQIIERSIAASCPTFFEISDDTNNSANDFAPASPSTPLRSNDQPIVETTCPTLNVLLGGGGTGTVAGGGINCPGVCSKMVPLNDVVNLTATPTGASTFTSWANCPVPNGAECQVTMDMSRTVTANFTAPPGGAQPVAPAPPKKKCKKGQKLKKGKCVKKKRKKK